MESSLYEKSASQAIEKNQNPGSCQLNSPSNPADSPKKMRQMG